MKVSLQRETQWYMLKGFMTIIKNIYLLTAFRVSLYSNIQLLASYVVVKCAEEMLMVFNLPFSSGKLTHGQNKSEMLNYLMC